MLALLFFVGTISPCLCKPVICRFAGFMPAYYYILRYIRQSHSRTISFCEYRNFFSDEDFFLWIVLNLSVKPNRRIADFIFIEIFMFVVGLFRCISVVRGCFLRRPCLFRWLPVASRWLEAVAMPSAGAAVLSEYVKKHAFWKYFRRKIWRVRRDCVPSHSLSGTSSRRGRGDPGRGCRVPAGLRKKVSEKLAGFENTFYLCNVFRRTPEGGSRNRTLKRLTIDNIKRRVVQEPTRRCRVEIREAPCHSTNV